MRWSHAEEIRNKIKTDYRAGNITMEKCQKCDAEMVRNPKTGKMFCKDKCWLKVEGTNFSKPDKPEMGWGIITDELALIKKTINDIIKLNNLRFK